MACNLSTKLTRVFLAQEMEGQIQQQQVQSGFGAWEYRAKRWRGSRGEISVQGCRETWVR